MSNLDYDGDGKIGLDDFMKAISSDSHESDK